MNKGSRHFYEISSYTSVTITTHHAFVRNSNEDSSSCSGRNRFRRVQGSKSLALNESIAARIAGG
jgi:hypothetical protein